MLEETLKRLRPRADELGLDLKVGRASWGLCDAGYVLARYWPATRLMLVFSDDGSVIRRGGVPPDDFVAALLATYPCRRWPGGSDHGKIKGRPRPAPGPGSTLSRRERELVSAALSLLAGNLEGRPEYGRTVAALTARGFGDDPDVGPWPLASEVLVIGEKLLDPSRPEDPGTATLAADAASELAAAEGLLAEKGMGGRGPETGGRE